MSATVQSQGRGPKIRIVKFRRRKHYRKTQGHRQSYTELRISGISGFSVAPTLQKAEVAPVQEG